MKSAYLLGIVVTVALLLQRPLRASSPPHPPEPVIRISSGGDVVLGDMTLSVPSGWKVCSFPEVWIKSPNWPLGARIDIGAARRKPPADTMANVTFNLELQRRDGSKVVSKPRQVGGMNGVLSHSEFGRHASIKWEGIEGEGTFWVGVGCTVDELPALLPTFKQVLDSVRFPWRAPSPPTR